jgi:hypothetical protein
MCGTDVEISRAGHIYPDLITHSLPLDRFLDAIGIAARGETIKVTIEP